MNMNSNMFYIQLNKTMFAIQKMGLFEINKDIFISEEKNYCYYV